MRTATRQRIYSVSYYVGAFLLRTEITATSPRHAYRLAQERGITPLTID